MRFRRLIVIAIVCLFIAAVGHFAEWISRRWRIPEYQVTVPLEFDSDEFLSVNRQGEEVTFSPRKSYLNFHRQGWEVEKEIWLEPSKGKLVNNMIAVAWPGNEARWDGRNQFKQEVRWKW